MKLILFTITLLAAESLAARCYCIYGHQKHNEITDEACPNRVKIDHRSNYYCEWTSSERSWIENCERAQAGATGDCI
ncbi:hypothetical protein LX36DRAFT_664776 [Colletotrichum falcatum]|nr:hypothetical protein LX36DRAFT_664776 [Colletotrichum falcatum]